MFFKAALQRGARAGSRIAKMPMKSSSTNFSPGDTVRYKPVGGPDSNTSESVGRITDVLTEPGQQAGRNVNASMEQPRYEIENLNTGKTSSIYERNILGIEK